MTGLEALLIKAAQAVITPAVTYWMAGRRRQQERMQPLSGLLERHVRDGMVRRRLAREIEAMADVVAARLAPLMETSLPDHERSAVLLTVVDAFTSAAADDAAFFAADADGARLAALIRDRSGAVPERAGLSEAARRLYDVILDECCQAYVKTVIHLASFAPRATAETLARLSGQAEQLARILDRLPARCLDAPAGTDLDEAFRRRYLAHIAATIDEVELFGIGLRSYRPRTVLSVAYISLSVATSAARHCWQPKWTPGELRRGGREHRVLDPAAPDERDNAGSSRVEHALSQAPRTFMRGEAGSGKTTVLRWLAITAARAGFTGALAAWNGRVPFLVRLRSYVDRPLPSPQQLIDATAETIAELAPPGWAHRHLADGQALLLIDGVDELPTARRGAMRDWLRRLLAEYPAAAVVVTSRPAATRQQWLTAEGFTATTLERMSPGDVRSLIAHWHRAVRDNRDLPCAVEDLPRYENALVGRLDANPHLQALATNPLLCAMLCALNLDRRTHLPRDRMSIYSAAVEMLLERRDAERAVATDVVLAGRDQLQLIQYLAWRMSINSESETSTQQAIERLEQRRATMPQVTCGATSVFEHLLHRSGLLRQPTADRLDFVHRTFQEYLTAREAADLGDVGLLVERAHLDTWRAVVIMAAGHANAATRHQLITQVLDRADAEPTHRRALRLVAAASLETVSALDPGVLDRVRKAIADLIPPRSTAEARSLAGIGEPLLAHLPADTASLSEAAAAALAQTVALINGPGALDALARYATDPRHRVQQVLAEVWEYFDPQDYADRVLVDAPLVDGGIQVRSPLLLPAIARLRHVTNVEVRLSEALDPAELCDVPYLRFLYLQGGADGSLVPLRNQQLLRYLRLENDTVVSDPGELAGLSQVEELQFYGHPNLTDLGFLDDMPDLTALGLGSLAQIPDLGFLRGRTTLKQVFLFDPRADSYADVLTLPAVEWLYLESAAPPRAGVADLVPPGELDRLSLVECDWVNDLGPLAAATGLRKLGVHDCPVTDLTPLAGLHGLRLFLTSGCPGLTDLSPLAELPELTCLHIPHAAPGIDLSPFAGRRNLTVVLRRGQDIRGTDRLGRGVKLLRV